MSTRTCCRTDNRITNWFILRVRGRDLFVKGRVSCVSWDRSHTLCLSPRASSHLSYIMKRENTMLFFTLWHTRCYFFPLNFHQGRENDKQTFSHTHTHTHTLVARTSDRIARHIHILHGFLWFLIWLVWLGFMFTVNQNAQQTQGHRVLQRRQSDAFPFELISLHSDEVMTYRGLHWYFISPNALLQYCITVYIQLFD